MAKKCMSCGGSMKKMQKGGNTSFGMLSVKAGVDNNPKPTAADRIAGAKKKMQKGGTMKTTVGGPAKKPFAAGIPYYTGAGQTGPESMQLGGIKSAIDGVKRINKIGKTVNLVNNKINRKKAITKGVTGPMTKTLNRLRATGKKK